MRKDAREKKKTGNIDRGYSSTYSLQTVDLVRDLCEVVMVRLRAFGPAARGDALSLDPWVTEGSWPFGDYLRAH